MVASETAMDTGLEGHMVLLDYKNITIEISLTDFEKTFKVVEK